MRYLISFLVAFAASALIGRFLIPWLHALKAGQSIKEIGPVWHMAKQGTPTMGRQHVHRRYFHRHPGHRLEGLFPGKVRRPVRLPVRPGLWRHRLFGRLHEGQVPQERGAHRVPEVPPPAGGGHRLHRPPALYRLPDPRPVYPLLQRQLPAALGGVHGLRSLCHRGHRQRGEPDRRRGRAWPPASPCLWPCSTWWSPSCGRSPT